MGRKGEAISIESLDEEGLTIIETKWREQSGGLPRATMVSTLAFELIHALSALFSVAHTKNSVCNRWSLLAPDFQYNYVCRKLAPDFQYNYVCRP